MAKLVTLRKAGEQLGISRGTFYNLRERGQIIFRYLGGRVFIDLDEVEARIILNTSKTKETIEV